MCEQQRWPLLYSLSQHGRGGGVGGEACQTGGQEVWQVEEGWQAVSFVALITPNFSPEELWLVGCHWKLLFSWSPGRLRDCPAEACPQCCPGELMRRCLEAARLTRRPSSPTSPAQFFSKSVAWMTKGLGWQPRTRNESKVTNRRQAKNVFWENYSRKQNSANTQFFPRIVKKRKKDNKTSKKYYKES